MFAGIDIGVLVDENLFLLYRLVYEDLQETLPSSYHPLQENHYVTNNLLLFYQKIFYSELFHLYDELICGLRLQYEYQ